MAKYAAIDQKKAKTLIVLRLFQLETSSKIIEKSKIKSIFFRTYIYLHWFVLEQNKIFSSNNL